MRVRLAKGPYGPFAEHLRHVLTAIDGYFISGFGAGGDEPDKTLEIIPGAVENARATLATIDRSGRVLRVVVNPVFLEQVLDDLLLMPVHPAGENQKKKLQWL